MTSLALQARMLNATDPGAEIARKWAAQREAKLAAISDSLASVERTFRALGISQETQ